jgi:hypothetical protein
MGILTAKMVDPLQGGEWTSLLNEFPDHSVFHTAEWARTLSLTYNHKPFYLKFERNGRAVGLAPIMEVSSPITGRRGVCLPFSDYSEVLLSEPKDSESALKLIEEITTHRNWHHFECRGGSVAPLLAKAKTFVGHVVDLNMDSDQLSRNLSTSVRRNIQKAIESGITVKSSRSMEAIQAFYTLHAQTRKRHGLPPQPANFFKNLHAEMVETGMGEVFLAFWNSKPIAAAVYLFTGKQAVYKYGASDSRYWNLRANHILMWKAMKALREKRMETLHLGRSAMDNAGLIRFKASWGAKAIPISYIRYLTRSRSWTGLDAEKSHKVRSVFGRLPLIANQFLGNILYPHLD